MDSSDSYPANKADTIETVGIFAGFFRAFVPNVSHVHCCYFELSQHFSFAEIYSLGYYIFKKNRKSGIRRLPRAETLVIS